MRPLVLILLTGCIALVKGGGGGGYRMAPAAGGPYAGPECQHIDHQNGGGMVFGSEGARPAGLSPLDNAVFVACMSKTGLNGIHGTDAIVADHLTFDDRHFDHLKASGMVMDCALNPGCSMELSRDVLGMMAGYARRLDPNAADLQLGAAGASADFRAAYKVKAQWAKDTVAKRVTELDPRRKAIWDGIPEQVWSERHDYFVKWATLYAALDPLLAVADSGTGDLAGAVRGIRELRGHYLDACKVEGCLFTPFILESTRALELLAVRMKDTPAALAEQALLSDERMASQYFSRAVVAALIPATTREAAEWEKYNRAKQSGADPASLAAMFGDTPPIQISPDGPYIVWGQRNLTDLTAALPREGIVSAGGNVRGVQTHGEMSTVIFADIVTESTDEDCHETSKVDGIGSDGRLIYRQDCRTTGTRTEHTKVEPITVPSDEAKNLRAGELVTAWVKTEGRKGEITFVHQQDKIVQVRAHRLKVKERPLNRR
ncbi:MAG: hypothetical protein QM831_18240 [Kofleriaceae bacterium]